MCLWQIKVCRGWTKFRFYFCKQLLVRGRYYVFRRIINIFLCCNNCTDCLRCPPDSHPMDIGKAFPWVEWTKREAYHYHLLLVSTVRGALSHASYTPSWRDARLCRPTLPLPLLLKIRVVISAASAPWNVLIVFLSCGLCPQVLALTAWLHVKVWIHILDGLAPIIGLAVKVTRMTSREDFQLNANQALGFLSFTFTTCSYDRDKGKVRHAEKWALGPEGLEPKTFCTEYKWHIHRAP
jgi:hypothetical protein